MRCRCGWLSRFGGGLCFSVVCMVSTVRKSVLVFLAFAFVAASMTPRAGAQTTTTTTEPDKPVEVLLKGAAPVLGYVAVPKAFAGSVTIGSGGGAGALGTSSGGFGALCAAGICPVAAGVAVAAASFALGYYVIGPSLCSSGAFAAMGWESVCSSGEWVDSTPEGFTAERASTSSPVCWSSLGTVLSASVSSGQGYGANSTCIRYSWDSIADFGGGPTTYAAGFTNAAGQGVTRRLIVQNSSWRDGCHVDLPAELNGTVPASWRGSWPYGCHGSASAGSATSFTAANEPGFVTVHSSMACIRPDDISAVPWTTSNSGLRGLLCGLNPDDRAVIFRQNPVGSPPFIGPGAPSSYTTVNLDEMVVAGLPADPDLARRGRPMVKRVTALCRNRSTGATTSRVATTPPYWEHFDPYELRSPCLSNEYGLNFTLQSQSVEVGTLATSVTMTGWTTEIEWVAPPEWSDPDWEFSGCLKAAPDRFCKVEPTEVPQVDPVTGDPVLDPETGQPVMIPSTTWGGRPTGEVDPTPELVIVRDPEDREQPPAEQPSSPPTTVPGGTAPPPTHVPPSGPAGSPVPPPPGGGQWATCMSDQGASWDDVTFNPITWVRAVVKWVWAPIYCALYWFFVPDFGELWDSIRDLWDENDVFDPVRAFVAGFQGGTGSGCLPVTLSLLSMTATVDVLMCENWGIQIAWTVVIGLGWLGVMWMFGDSLSDLSYARRRR